MNDTEILDLLSDKLDIDLSNAPANLGFIKNVITNENGTCVMFSNNFKIQWGMYERAANATTPTTIVFPKRFNTTKYFLNISPIYNGDIDVRYFSEQVGTRSVSNVAVTYSLTKANWIAVGF